MDSKITLYDIKESFIDLFEQAEQGNVSTDELNKKGNDLAIALQNKSANIIAFDRQLEAYIDFAKKEKERINEYIKSLENKKSRFEEYLKSNMQEMQLTEITTGIGSIKLRKNPASVEVIDESLIPEEYKKEKVTYTVDKALIKKDLQAGKNVFGACLIEDKTSIQIK